MAEVIVQEESLVTVADAIREKTGGTEGLVFPTGFAEAITSISTGAEVSCGIIKPSEDTTSLSWEHGLSKAPSLVFIWLPMGYSFTTYANIMRGAYYKKTSLDGIDLKELIVASRSSTSYVYHENGKAAGYEEIWTIDDTTITANVYRRPSNTNDVKFVGGQPYHWIAIADDNLIFPYK